MGYITWIWHFVIMIYYDYSGYYSYIRFPSEYG